MNSVTFSPDGSRLAAGGYGRSVQLFDMRKREKLEQLRGHDDWVNGVAYDPPVRCSRAVAAITASGSGMLEPVSLCVSCAHTRTGFEASSTSPLLYYPPWERFFEDPEVGRIVRTRRERRSVTVKKVRPR